MVRTFVAIPLGEPARTAVTAYLERLRATVAGVGWSRSDHLHLTLEFLGNVGVDRIPALAAHLQTGLAPLRAFTLEAVGVGAFPSLARPRVLWIGLRAPALGALAAAVGAACAAAGFPTEHRPFRPHVTLGRVREPAKGKRPELGWLATDGDRVFGTAGVDEVVLFRSDLGSGGARHTALARFPLPPDG